MDNFISLSNRLLSQCPAIGPAISQQFVNDCWKSLQARRIWSWRRKSAIIQPPSIYLSGSVSTNVSAGNANLLTGSSTDWTQSMVGRQIRVGGLSFPFYTIAAVFSPTSLLLDMPWAGPEQSNASYMILQSLYPMPRDFGSIHVMVSVKDAFRLWTTVTASELAVFDPQRTNYGQTYAAVFRDYTSQYGGTIGPVIPVTSTTNPAPVSTTTTGYTFVADATYVVSVVTGGVPGVSTFKWMRSGQSAFMPDTPTSEDPVDLDSGVQVYWPTATYVSGDTFIINCKSVVGSGVPRIEMWPAPTSNTYLYPYIYIQKEYDLTADAPSLPPFMDNRGDVLLEMALERCASFPGTDPDHINIYYSLQQAKYHQQRVQDMLVDLERNDEEVGVSNIEYFNYSMAPAPWGTGEWQQRHSPWGGY